LAAREVAALTSGPFTTLRGAVKRSLITLPLLLAALACGCGSSDAGGSDDDTDIRAGVFDCLTQDKGIDARLDGEDTILLAEDDTAPKIRFFLTAGEAEAAQFEGDGEGSEQIGAALLFVRPEIRDDSEEMLEDVEKCLADQ
jgi:hypothetical protein